MRAVVVGVLGVVAMAAGPAQGLDRALYAELLEAHTREVTDLAGTRVDYAALTRAKDWRRLVEGLADAEPDGLAGRDAQLAFWIDVYNVLAIHMVVRHYPVGGIREIGSLLRSVWKRPAGEVGDRTLTLDQIEHDILRPMGDPRIHGAIVCASLSCPPLAREPYRPEALDAQLDANLRRWLADPRKGVRLDRPRRTLHVSPIFDWFEEDFEAAGGVLPFLARYAPADVAEAIREGGASLRIRTLDYDWSLNDLSRAGR